MVKLVVLQTFAICLHNASSHLVIFNLEESDIHCHLLYKHLSSQPAPCISDLPSNWSSPHKIMTSNFDGNKRPIVEWFKLHVVGGWRFMRFGGWTNPYYHIDWLWLTHLLVSLYPSARSILHRRPIIYDWYNYHLKYDMSDTRKVSQKTLSKEIFLLDCYHFQSAIWKRKIFQLYHQNQPIFQSVCVRKVSCTVSR